MVLIYLAHIKNYKLKYVHAREIKNRLLSESERGGFF